MHCDFYDNSYTLRLARCSAGIVGIFLLLSSGRATRYRLDGKKPAHPLKAFFIVASVLPQATLCYSANKNVGFLFSIFDFDVGVAVWISFTGILAGLSLRIGYHCRGYNPLAFLDCSGGRTYLKLSAKAAEALGLH